MLSATSPRLLVRNARVYTMEGTIEEALATEGGLITAFGSTSAVDGDRDG